MRKKNSLCFLVSLTHNFGFFFVVFFFWLDKMHIVNLVNDLLLDLNAPRHWIGRIDIVESLRIRIPPRGKHLIQPTIFLKWVQSNIITLLKYSNRKQLLWNQFKRLFFFAYLFVCFCTFTKLIFSF